MDGELSQYDRAAIRILAKHLEAEVPYLTVASLLDHQGWADLLETIFKCYPDAFLALCVPHQREIEEAMGAGGGVIA